MRISVRGFAKRVAVGSAIAALLVGSTLTASPAAASPKKNPQPSCTGSEVGDYNTHGGKVSVFVYYSSANGGTNCVWAQKETKRGTPEYMQMAVGIEGQPADKYDVDKGYFEYYAGPVEVGNTADECILVFTEYRGVAKQLGPFHCG